MGVEPSPADLFGPLLAKVQERAILPDSKTFVDALPKRPVADIMHDFALLPADDEALRAFIAANFDLPAAAEGARPAVLPLREHIRALWKDLARAPKQAASGSALAVQHRHVVPGGRFREIYYWDSFFTMLGLVRDGEHELANGIVEAMTDLIEAHGHVPNGTRTYYLGRSQPPLFHMMVELLDDERADVAARRLSAMKREHTWWMEGAEGLAPGEQNARVTRLADGALLNRYWDPRSTPRDESWREDVATAAESGRPVEEVYRDLRAGAESGWDFSSRWLDGDALSSIRTTAIAPIDLNAFLFGLETAIAARGDRGDAHYARLADERREAMNRHLWNSEGGYFADYDVEEDKRRNALTAAALAPLLVGAATQEQADATARAVEDALLAPGGIHTTLLQTGQQWDRPNGWAPLQWIAVAGLGRYGHGALAREIARRWVDTVGATFTRTGLLFEKYDVEATGVGGGGEYETQTGFGWTNGVTADFIDSYDFLPTE
ncbi:alpha,alpha-trehalase [Sphingopyxis sp. OAS728]|uniref:alpha,alpha-trehalase TreF n=1 Tax=Sphingopyxis sp. OAS728 TaxID=2663823 RepID=UPI00178AFDA5|nr:alpha,alpha-trehalase TreF [Sphingopyxis sp. OAS728]MBE1527170.1 alpha,alpha-trehalase [Sphingopyxis sp. OAS728]